MDLKPEDLYKKMTLGVVYQDREGKIIAANPAAEKILGLTLDQMQGRTSVDPRWKSVHEDGTDFQGDTHPAMVSLRTGKEVHDVIMGVFNPIKEEYKWIKIDAYPQFHFGESRPWQVYTTFEDITSRKNAIDNLKKLTLRYKALLASVPDIIMEVDKNKIYTWCNEAGKEFFGEDVIGRSADYYFEGEQDTYRIIQPIINGHEDVIYVESWQKRKDGAKRLLAWWCRVLKDDRGHVTGALSTARDITERRSTEDALRENEKKYRTLFNTMEEGVVLHEVVYDKQGRAVDYRITDVNPAYEKHTGISRNAALDQMASKLYSKDFLKYLDIYARVAQTGEPGHFESYFPSINKHFSVSLFSPEKNKLAAVFSDITTPKHAKNALEKSEMEKTLILNTTSEMFCYYDRSLTILWANAAAGASLNLQAEELIGKKCYEMWHQSNTPCEDCPVLKARDTGLPHEKEMQTPDGLFYYIRGYPVFDKEQKITGMVEFTHNITERKKAEIALQQKISELEQFNRFMVGREHKMIELKKQVNELSVKLGLPEPYSIPCETE